MRYLTWFTRPTVPVTYQNGHYGYVDGNPFISSTVFKNPIYALNNGYKDNKHYRFDGQFYGEIDIWKGLKFRSSLAYKYYMNDTSTYNPKSLAVYDADGNELQPAGTMNSLSDYHYLETSYINENILTYTNRIGKHEFTILLGHSIQGSRWDSNTAGIQDFPTENIYELNGGSQNPSVEGEAVETALQSFFGRVNYNYDGRYLFEANLRYDGTSRFPKNNRFGLFPSFSLGWRISEEAFFNAENIDNLKLRASWGQLGNQEIGDYAFYNTYVFGMDYAFNNQLSPGVSINETMGNSNITWEKTSQLDLGIDIDAWNGKLSATFDYFDKKTNDILLALPTPDILGVSSPMQNAGSVLNRGFEFSITHRNRINDFSYGVNFNFSYVHNEITDLKGADQPGISVGDPVQNVFGYICDGIFRSQEEIDNSPQQIWGAVPGDLKYRDVNGDNVVDDDDRVSIGSDFPSINYGFRLEMGYKNFDFSTLLQGAGDVHALVRDEIAKPFHNGGKVTSKFLDSWTPENPDASCPRLSIQNATKNKYVSTYWVQNASYLKMRNIQLGYTFAPNITKRLGLSRLRMYFSADNVFTITSFEGVDPESTGNNYPLTRSYSFGVNVSF